MSVPKQLLEDVALSEQEYRLIVEKLGREPTPVELGMFGSLWSEHCGYKHSKLLLRLLPARSRIVLVKPGEENAGVVDIGGGLIAAMKMESHNHPSAIEPFQGAATGVGGIVRDIFTMGIRPVALFNPLRFGPLSEKRNRYLLNGVVGGIAGYGNCLGIPNMGGEIFFSPGYSDNPLVNVLCLGLGRSKELVKARASGEDNPVMLVGADTGRDGLHGASGLASRPLDGRELRSAVQVGNPFLEKLLIEACLELAGTDWIVGMQDLGAAGLTSAAVESADRGGAGIEIDVLKVPRRESGMTPYEVMLSESQERMLVVVKKGCEDRVKAVFDRWDLRSDVIGRVTGGGMARIKEGEKVVAEVPTGVLNSPPLYYWKVRKPAWLVELQQLDLSAVPDLTPKECGSVLLSLLASPNICSKELVYHQYDHQVMDNSVVLPGSDAAVLRVKETGKGLALSADGNARYCYLNPRAGGAIAVAEAARNVACSGAQPIALTDCLNLGNPEKDDVFYQLKEVVKGIAQACRRLKTPVISGNVSLYNEAGGSAIYPTPVIGMLGLMDDVRCHCTSGFKRRGDLVFLLGGAEPRLDGSEYLEMAHGMVRGNPAIDLDLERRVQQACIEAIKLGVLRSAHDCSEGGLAVALAESAIQGGLGFNGRVPADGRRDTALFGEAQSRIVVSLAPERADELAELAAKWQAPLTRLGTAGGDRFVVKGLVDLALAEITDVWRTSLEGYLK